MKINELQTFPDFPCNSNATRESGFVHFLFMPSPCPLMIGFSALEIEEALERAAKDDDRSVSSLVERILKGWLAEKGYLTKAE